MPLVLRVFLGLILALIPAAFVQVQMEREAREARGKEVAQQAARLVSLLARQQAGIIMAAEQTLAAMSAHDSLRAMVPSDECDAFLARLIAASPRYNAADLFDTDGRDVCSGSPLGGTVNVSHRRYFRAVLQSGALEVGDYAVGLATSQPSLHIAAPMRGDDGTIRGVVVVALSLEWLQRDLESLALPGQSAATIADRTGVILARNREPQRFIGQPLWETGMRLLLAPTAGTVDAVSIDGIRRVAGFIPAHEGPGNLFLAIGLETDALVGDYVRADRRSAIMIVGSLLLTFLLALVAFQRTIDRPMQRLLATAQRWSRQEWRARVGSIGGTTEFTRLAAAFDTMAETIQTREAARVRATTRLAAMQEVAPQIVLTADSTGGVDWTNNYWRDLTGQTETESLGDGWLKALHPDDRDAALDAWSRVVASATAGTEAIFDVEARIRHVRDRSWRWFLLRGAAVREPGGVVRALAAVGVDIHALRETRAELAATAAQLHATYENAPVGLCILDTDLRYVAVNGMLAGNNRRSVQDHIGRTIEEIAPDVAATITPVLRQVIETGKPITDFEATRIEDGSERTWLCNFFPMRDKDGVVSGVSAAVIDITARRRVEESQRLLSREVDHRAQNALSVVRGLVRLSAMDAPDDVPTLVTVIEGRISAMARAHDVLSREKWVAADMRELVTQELEPYRARATIEGPSLRLRAEAAQPFTLVLHELVTNATKYGALSRGDGRVAIAWTLAGDSIAIHWEETGGPPIAAVPTRVGFGSQLIAANLRAQLGGTIERIWRATGLVCDIRLAADVVLAGRRAITALSPQGNALTGRRVLLAHEDPSVSAPLSNALRAAGCDVVGPARTLPELQVLLERIGAFDAAVLPATLAGQSVQPIAPLLLRRAGAVIYLSGVGLAPEQAARAIVVAPAGGAEAVIAALIRALATATAAE